MTGAWAVPVALVMLSALVMAACIVRARNVGAAERSTLDRWDRARFTPCDHCQILGARRRRDGRILCDPCKEATS